MLSLSQSFFKKMGCVKLHILNEQYKSTELRVSYINKELTFNNSAENARRCILVNNIDPTGMDWYSDKDSTFQYNPDLTQDNQSELLKKGQLYLGTTYQAKDKKGNITADYRKDGSIMYANDKDAYNRIISNTEKTGNEENLAILDKGVLVFPSYANDETTANWKTPYGYTTNKNGNIIDPVSGNTLKTVATAHTHPNGDPNPSSWTYDGYGDLGVAAYLTPYKPVYVFAIGKENVSFIYAAPGATKTGEYFKYNVTKDISIYNMTNLRNGQFNLRKFTNAANFRIALPKVK
jgi:hypothetical protein